MKSPGPRLNKEEREAMAPNDAATADPVVVIGWPYETSYSAGLLHGIGLPS